MVAMGYSYGSRQDRDHLLWLRYVILTNSSMLWIIGLLGAILNLLAPSIEESWPEE
jgi:hypothetical protein